MADHRTEPSRAGAFPPLPYDGWQDTLATLQRYVQIVGKIRMARAPMMNHWWQVALYVTSRGLTTSPIPAPQGSFELEFDFLAHELQISTSGGERVLMSLEPRPVAEFYRDVISTVRGLGIPVTIGEVPQEIPDDVTPFSQDTHHRSYDREAVGRWFRGLVQADLALKDFRAGFTGKCSPVHFFWGAFDLAVTRFSGRPAPAKEGADAMYSEAYCEEVSSAGFWPGTSTLGGAAFYAYAVPEPAGFSTEARGLPEGAFYDGALGEYLLPWAAVREADDPRRAIRAFLDATYVAAAQRGGWDRPRLERPFQGHPPHAAIPLDEASRAELVVE